MARKKDSWIHMKPKNAAHVLLGKESSVAIRLLRELGKRNPERLQRIVAAATTAVMIALVMGL